MIGSSVGLDSIDADDNDDTDEQSSLQENQQPNQSNRPRIGPKGSGFKSTHCKKLMTQQCGLLLRTIITSIQVDLLRQLNQKKIQFKHQNFNYSPSFRSFGGIGINNFSLSPTIKPSLSHIIIQQPQIEFPNHFPTFSYLHSVISSNLMTPQGNEEFKQMGKHLADIVEGMSKGQLTIQPFGSLPCGLGVNTSDIDCRIVTNPKHSRVRGTINTKEHYKQKPAQVYEGALPSLWSTNETLYL